MNSRQPRMSLAHPPLRAAALGIVVVAALLALLAPLAQAAPTKPAKPKHEPVTTSPLLGPAGPALKSAAATKAPKVVRGPKRGNVRTLAQAATTKALILYDTTGPYGWLGQSYATMVANLASHFGSWTAKPVASYAAGNINQFTATIYIGSTYDEPLPAAFLSDVKSSTKPVIWMYDNIWQLTAATPTFQTDYGWMWSGFDTGTVNEVDYKGQALTRDGTHNLAGIMNYSAVAAPAQVLAIAKRADGTTFPWAIRSKNLTYIGEIPLAYFSESDRMMVFEDLLFDALAPGQFATPRHRALVRIEDISPDSDPNQLRAIADYLSAQKVPFGFGVIPRYTDPLGAQNNGTPTTVTLAQRPNVVSALKYMQSKGGVMIDHGWTHQYSNVKNPYNGVTADDFEFYRTIENADHTLTFQGPVAEDSAAWADSRLTGARTDFTAAGFTRPSIFEFPHYFGSAVDYQRVKAAGFTARWERAFYPLGALTGAAPDYSRGTGQMFPYVVTDAYGTKVLPESLGNVELEPFFQFPVRLPAAIVADAQRNLVIRDGVAGFYFHPFIDVSYLKQVVEPMKALGYTFVNPTTL